VTGQTKDFCEFLYCISKYSHSTWYIYLVLFSLCWRNGEFVFPNQLSMIVSVLLKASDMQFYISFPGMKISHRRRSGEYGWWTVVSVPSVLVVGKWKSNGQIQHGGAIFVNVSSQRMCCWAFLLERSFAADWNSACHFVCRFCLYSDFKLHQCC